MILPLTAEQQAWAQSQAEKNGLFFGVHVLTKDPKVNPCIAVFGAGPDGKLCKQCSHLFRAGGWSRKYIKCDLRHRTSGAGTDHRANWPACAKFKPA